MANFSTKIFGLAGAAVVFAGMAFGQATCTTPTSNANFVPVEATTAQVASLTFTCNGATAGGILNVQVFLSPSLPITSKVIDTSTGKTEATLSNGTNAVQGTATGSSINFTGLVLVAGTQTITISNVRINASSIAVGTGVPPAITETAFVSGAGAVPVALAPTTVAFAQSGISAKAFSKTFNSTTGALSSTASGANNFVICNAQSFSLSTVIQINENFASAFKAASEASTTPVMAGTGNAINTNDRLQIVFTNVPANATIYVPVSAIPSQNSATAKIQATSSGTGTFTALTASTSSSAPTVYGGGVAALTATGGTATAYFDVVTEDNNAIDQFNVPVYVSYSANAVAGSNTAITASVSYAPVGSTQIPNFVIGSSTTALAGTTFQQCTTSLLFPFVTNQLGFDTGIAISNTSTDPFGTQGAVAQAGTCTMNFYGAGAPSAAVTTPNVPSGTTYAVVLSSVAAGFQGYVITQCNFQYAHAFAFITDGVGANGGLSQGYLASVIPDTNQAKRAAGVGEVLGN